MTFDAIVESGLRKLENPELAFPWTGNKARWSELVPCKKIPRLQEVAERLGLTFVEMNKESKIPGFTYVYWEYDKESVQAHIILVGLLHTN